jgi:hypothetical protein
MLLLLASCSASAATDHATPPGTELGDRHSYLLRVASPQSGDGHKVVVAEVVIDTGQGYAVAYADGHGAPGVRLGVSALLPTGSSTDVSIPLDPAVSLPAHLYVMVHKEDNGNSTFDFPKGDAPAQAGAGVLVTTVDLVAA